MTLKNKIEEHKKLLNKYKSQLLKNIKIILGKGIYELYFNDICIVVSIMNSKYKSEVDYGIDIPYDFADDKKSLNNYLSEVKEIVKLHDHENHGELQAFLNRLYKKQ